MKTILRLLAFTIVFLVSFHTFSQSTPFSITLEPLDIPELGGIQSYAFAQDNGKWLIIGGRLDGLHQRQPFAAFDIAGHNNQLLVIDPVSQKKWSAPLTSLPTPIQEQLSATNMEFYQDGDYLYFVGGYGYSATLSDHTTYDKLTAIKVPDVINAIVNGSGISTYFRQISHPDFQVTGGRFQKINNTYYLVGGQKFIGRYNPSGPNSGQGFTQEYTNQIRKFNITDDGTTITVNHLPSITDAVNLHRRDYNVTAQIMPNGNEGLTAFSGVFQPTADLPFLNSVNIESSGYTVNNNFTQYYNHYHCANIPLYSAINNEMHTVFFGGIAQFYDNAGTLVQDNEVPFVKTIARVTRDASGTMTEYKLPIEMPSLLGTGSEFIPNETLPLYTNYVIKLDELTNDPTLVGYIYGGISSTAENIFLINDGTQSSATSQIFKVILTKNTALGVDHLNGQSISNLKLMVYPNPNNGTFKLKYYLHKSSDVHVVLYSLEGKKIEDKIFKNQPAGEINYETTVQNLPIGGTYILTVKTEFETATQKIIIKP